MPLKKYCLFYQSECECVGWPGGHLLGLGAPGRCLYLGTLQLPLPGQNILSLSYRGKVCDTNQKWNGNVWCSSCGDIPPWVISQLGWDTRAQLTPRQLWRVGAGAGAGYRSVVNLQVVLTLLTLVTLQPVMTPQCHDDSIDLFKYQQRDRARHVTSLPAKQMFPQATPTGLGWIFTSPLPPPAACTLHAHHTRRPHTLHGTDRTAGKGFFLWVAPLFATTDRML